MNSSKHMMVVLFIILYSSIVQM